MYLKKFKESYVGIVGVNFLKPVSIKAYNTFCKIDGKLDYIQDVLPKLEKYFNFENKMYDSYGSIRGDIGIHGHFIVYDVKRGVKKIETERKGHTFSMSIPEFYITEYGKAEWHNDPAN